MAESASGGGNRNQSGENELWPWPAPDEDDLCDHLVAGLPLPDVSLPATLGEPIDLSRVRGRSVLFVYPYTGRPGLADPPNWDDIKGAHGSTPQAEGFRDLFDAFSNIDVNVFGLSSQDHGHQLELAGRLALPFPVLSDANGKFQSAMQLPTFEAGDRTFLKRVTLVIDDGRITKTIYPVHPPDQNARAVLSFLRD